MTGPLILVLALLAALVLGVVHQRRTGVVRSTASAQDEGDQLTADQLGSTLGERATLVQFSSAFCAPCRATRVVLADVAAGRGGVEALDIDAESHLDLVRELGVMKTPTTLVLDADGRVVARAAGVPRREQVVAALDALA